MVARLVRNEKVRGSNPLSSTMTTLPDKARYCVGLAESSQPHHIRTTFHGQRKPISGLTPPFGRLLGLLFGMFLPPAVASTHSLSRSLVSPSVAWRRVLSTTNGHAPIDCSRKSLVSSHRRVSKRRIQARACSSTFHTTNSSRGSFAAGQPAITSSTALSCLCLAHHRLRLAVSDRSDSGRIVRAPRGRSVRF